MKGIMSWFFINSKFKEKGIYYKTALRCLYRFAYIAQGIILMRDFPSLLIIVEQ